MPILEAGNHLSPLGQTSLLNCFPRLPTPQANLGRPRTAAARMDSPGQMGNSTSFLCRWVAQCSLRRVWLPGNRWVSGPHVPLRGPIKVTLSLSWGWEGYHHLELPQKQHHPLQPRESSCDCHCGPGGQLTGLLFLI